MIKVSFQKENLRHYKILCLGAHSDDIEIGCGGTILRFLKEHTDTEVYWVVFGAHGQRRIEAENSANQFLEGVKKKNIVIHSFKDGFFPYIGGEVKEYFEQLKREYSPDLIFTHYREDLHQDHRLISELTWNSFRDHIILEYEVIKYDGDLGAPNFFVHLDEAICQKKIETIVDCFKTQEGRTWFGRDVFFSLLRIRGLECGAPGKYAEGYYGRKIVF
jgi:LmbE family N-acetylglucosaminyl deacetylase